MIEPFRDLHRQPSRFQKVEHRSTQSCTDPFRGRTGRILMEQIVFGEPAKLRPHNLKAVATRIEPDWTVRSDGESMPKCGLNQVSRGQLADAFECIDGFLHRFRWKAIHEIGMHEN